MNFKEILNRLREHQDILARRYGVAVVGIWTPAFLPIVISASFAFSAV